MKTVIKDVMAMEGIGQDIARKYSTGGVVFLSGTLGAGKTTIARGVLRALGFKTAVKSPTYTIVEIYDLASITVCHFDLYRLSDGAELEQMGFRDYLDDNALVLIEWPERALAYLPTADMQVNISYHVDGREVEICEKSG